MCLKKRLWEAEDKIRCGVCVCWFVGVYNFCVCTLHTHTYLCVGVWVCVYINIYIYMWMYIYLHPHIRFQKEAVRGRDQIRSVFVCLFVCLCMLRTHICTCCI